MARKYDTDVVICGAGPTGLTLAIELARRNVSFRLIDKSPEPFPGSRGKGIQARTQEVFEDLGILDRVVASGGQYPTARVYTDGGPIDRAAVPPPPTPAEPYHLALLVPQFLTERRMRERLAELGHAAEFGRPLVGFEQDDEVVTAHIGGAHGEETVRARYLVGADGGSSFVRKTLGVAFPGRTLGVEAVVADLRVEGLSWDLWHRWGDGTQGREFSLCPLYGTDMYQLMAAAPAEGEVDLTPEGLTALARERTGRDDIVVREVSWASVFTMQARLADSYRVGRVFLAGDAAHCHPPTGGQGLNTSVQDAYNLGWKIAAVIDGASAALLDTYEEERRAIAEDMLGLTKRLLGEAKAGGMRRGRDVMQLDVGYRGSSLGLPCPGRDKGVLPGDRAPDAPVTGAAGQTVRLFHLFQGTHWTLLGYEPGTATIAPRRGLRIHIVGADIHDTQGHVRDAYGLEAGDWALIRPDGYVAAVVGTAGLGSIESFLDRVGVRPVR